MRVLVNTPPQLTIITPMASAILNITPPNNITGSVSDIDGTVTKLEFFYKSTAPSSPSIAIGAPIINPTGMFSHVWANAPSGYFEIIAVATDSDGATTKVIVPVKVNAAPTISITAPSAATTYYIVNNPINFTVNAADSDGTINRVEYYRGTVKIGTVTTAPYSFIWTDASLGIHSITAKVIDNDNAQTTSAAKTVDIDVTNLPVCKLHLLHQSPGTPTVEGVQLDLYLLTVSCTKSEGRMSHFFRTGPQFDGSRGIGGGNMNGIDLHVVPPTESLDPIAGSQIIRMHPGTHTFWVRTVRHSDNAEGSPVSLTATLVANRIPPTVTITNPVSGSNVAFSGIQPISVSITGGNLNIQRIELYLQRTDYPSDLKEYPIGVIGNLSAPTGQFTLPIWNKYVADDLILNFMSMMPRLVANAQYKLIAYAVNTNWISAKGEATFTAVASPPFVTIEQPANNLLVKDAPVTMRAQATIDNPGTMAGIMIQSLQFFNGTTPITPLAIHLGNGNYQLTWIPPGVGTYFISAKATSSVNVTGSSNAIQITVVAPVPLAGSDTPATDANGDNLTDILGSGTITTVGATAGSFDVSESGSAGYSIPIALPPGTAGMVPSVALSYNSQGGGGLLGVGWSMSGLSAIHRCPKNYFLDGKKGKVSYDNNDVFCLDGQRLVEVSSTSGTADKEYRTERESYSRITFNASGNSWKVESKSGLIMFYGTDEQGGANHARLVVDGIPSNSIYAAANGATKSWALSKTIDRQGNFYLVEYEKDAELAQRPKRMRYTGNTAAGINPYASVEFEYGANLPEEQALLFDSAGTTSQQTKILKAIKTQIGTNLVRSYQLAYDVSAQTKRSVLRSITECGYGVNVTDVNSADKLCLPPTEFNTLTPIASDSTFVQQVIPPVYEGMSGQGITRVMDMNGDGKSDFIRYKGNNNWGVRLSGDLNNAGQSVERIWTSSHPYNGVTSGGTDTRVAFGDFNGDGKTDFVSQGGNVWSLCTSTGNGFNCSTLIRNGQLNDIPPVPTSPDEEYSLTGDFDGDGRIDLAFYKGRDINTYVSKWQVCLANGTGFTCTGEYNGPVEGNNSLGTKGKLVGDFNGDGRADIAGYGHINNHTNNWQVAFSNFSTGTTTTTSTFGFGISELNREAVFTFPYRSIVADMNGDGLADLVAAEENQGDINRSKWRVCISKGDGTFSCSYWPGRWYQNIFSVMGDYNGDGRTDIAEFQTGVGWNVCLSTGVSFNCQTWGGAVPSAGDTTNYFQFNLAGDFDGNGKTDIAIYSGASADHWKVIGATGATPDLMAKAKDGLGKEVNFTYKPLTLTGAGNIYTKGAGAVFPLLDIQSPMYLVSQMSTNDGIGGVRNFSYQYKDLRGHSQGAGLLGFAERTVKDELTNRHTRTQYSHDYLNRLAGMPLKTELSVGTNGCNVSNTCLSRSTMQHASSAANGVPTSPLQLQIWTTFTTETKSETFDPNVSTTMAYLTTTSTSPAPNAFGNLSNSSTSTNDGFSKSTTTTYFDGGGNVSTWLLGRPDLVTVTSNAPGSSIARASSFTYKANSHLVETETIEPSGASDLRLSTAYSYDTVGNRTSTTISGAGVTSRQSIVSYSGDPNKRFATSATNALGHSASSAYLDRFGAVTLTTDANGIFSRTRYDRLGRKVAAYSSLGTNQQTCYHGNTEPNNTVLCQRAILGAVMSITTTTTGAPSSTSHVDLLGREIRRDTYGYSGALVSAVTEYDSRGRKTRTSRPFYSGETPTYTNFNYEDDTKLHRLLSETDANNGTTTYVYDGFTGRVTRNPGGGVATQTTTRVSNSQGWNTSVTDANNQTTNFAYDALGNLLQVTKPDGSQVTMTYDLRSRKKSLVDPDAGTINYTYNAYGELLTENVVGGRGTPAGTPNQYDVLGRLTSRAESANGKLTATTNVYDCANAKGKLCTEKLDQPSGSTTRSYARDNLSRVSEVSTEIIDIITGTVSTPTRLKTFISQSRYDSLSRPKLYRYPISGLTLQNDYNALGFTAAVRELRSTGDVIHWQANSRNANGQITSMNVGGQPAGTTTTTKTYDSIGRLKTINTGALQAASYDWDLVGNLTRRSDTAANAVSAFANSSNETFCHDKLNRVTHVAASALNCASPGAAQFSYSPLGNLTKSGVATTYQANGNKLLTVNGQTVQYDVGGNITNDGSRLYTYNAFDIPDSITQTVTTPTNPGTYQSQWGFGPDKQRTYEVTSKATTTNGTTFNPLTMTWFASPGHFEVDEEKEANGNWKLNECRHTIGSPEGNIGLVVTNCSNHSQNSDFTDRYYLKDHLGSNAGTFKQNALESRATYDVWGMRIESGNTDYDGIDSSNRGYTGHEHLTTFGLIHMNGRIYDPLLGRFLQADPIIDEPFNLQSYNRYSYVGNNPLAFTDPTGYSRWTNFRDRYYIPFQKIV